MPHRKGTLSKRVCFFWKSNCTYNFWTTSNLAQFFWYNTIFFNLTIAKPTAPVYQNTLTFYWYLFISRSNMHVNLVYWNSLHPKKANLSTFLGQTPHFLSDKQKTRSKNHLKSGSVEVFLSLREGVEQTQ